MNPIADRFLPPLHNRKHESEEKLSLTIPTSQNWCWQETVTSIVFNAIKRFNNHSVTIKLQLAVGWW